jgi:hypothetical protein
MYACVCMCVWCQGHLIWGENQHGLETSEVNPAVRAREGWREGERDGGRERCKGGRDAGSKGVSVRPGSCPRALVGQ